MLDDRHGSGVPRDLPFVGRELELRQIGEAFPVLRQRRQVIVEVVGDAGIGKTRLIREALTRYPHEPIRALVGAAAEAERRIPFNVFLHAFADPAVMDVDPDLADDWDWLVAAVARVPTEAAESAELDVARFRLYQAGRRILARLAGNGLVLVLDDLHWADSSSLGMIGHLMRYPVPVPLFLVLAYRPRQLSGHWPQKPAPAGLAGVHRIELGPLPPPAAARLLPDPVGRDDFRRRYRDSGGNPRQLLALGEPGWPGKEESESRLLDEWTPLTEPDGTVAAAGAVLGDRFDVDMVAAVAELPVPEVRAAVGRLVGRDLVRPADGATFALRHPVLRRLIYDRVDPVWRLGVHRRAITELERRGVPATASAGHVRAALALPGGDATDADIEILLRAAEEVARSEPNAAADWLRLALNVLGTGRADGARQREISLLLAHTLGVAGRLAESRTILHDVLRSLPADPKSRRASIVAFCGRMEWLLGHYAEADALLRRELSILDVDDAPSDAVRLAVQHGVVAVLAGQIGTAGPALDEAARIADGRDDPVERATVQAIRALGEVHEGAVTAARASVACCAPLIDGLPDSDLIDQLECLSGIGLTELFLERYADAARHFDRGIAMARRSGLSLTLPHLLLGRCQVSYVTGRLTEAIDLAREAGRVATRMGSRDMRCFALAFESESIAWRGAPDDPCPIELAEQALECASDQSGWYGHRTAAVALANARLLAGDGEGCAQLILEVGRDETLSGLQTSLRPLWFRVLTAASLTAGDVRAARGWAERGVACAEALDLPGQRGFAELAMGEVELAEGVPAAALPRLRTAASLFRQSGITLHEAVAKAGGARAAAQLGEPGTAARLRGQALDLANRCGSVTVAELVAAADLASPVTTPAGGPGPGALLRVLTSREREIAELTATGATAHSIGRVLAISPRTVEAHLSRIYRKLNVSSRAALVALVTRGEVGSASSAE